MVRTETLNSQSTILPDCKSYSCKDFGRITLFVIGIIACILGTLILLHVGSFSQIDDAWGWGGVGGGSAAVGLSLLLGYVGSISDKKTTSILTTDVGSTSGNKTFFAPGERNYQTEKASAHKGELPSAPKSNHTYKGFYVGNDKSGMDMVIKVVVPGGEHTRTPYPPEAGYDYLLSTVQQRWDPSRGPEYPFYLDGKNYTVHLFTSGINLAQSVAMHERVKQALSAGKKVLFYHEPVASGVIGGEIALFLYQMLETNQTRDTVIADFESEFSIEYPKTNLSMLGITGKAASIDNILPPTVDVLRKND